jgi:uncharacterized membrane protein YphA (DoxX/SURF4 family)
VLIGLYTPLAAFVVAVGALGVAWSRPAALVVDGPTVPLLIAGVAVAVAFLGPGVGSLDSLLFGHRRIVIPRDGERPPSKVGWFSQG